MSSSSKRKEQQHTSKHDQRSHVGLRMRTRGYECITSITRTRYARAISARPRTDRVYVRVRVRVYVCVSNVYTRSGNVVRAEL